MVMSTKRLLSPAAVKKTLKHMIKKVYSGLFGEVWLISDRIDMAGDNGEAMFEYLRQKGENAVFVLERNSADYDRMRKKGKVVPFGSIRYHFLCAVATVHMSSQLGFRAANAIEVYLAHGISEKDRSEYMNRLYRVNPNLYLIAAGDKEYEAFRTSSYEVPKNHVLLTGLARYDLLENASEKMVVYCPTWRAGFLKDAASPAEIEKRIRSSEYFSHILSLFNDTELKSKLKKRGYTLMFKPHPNLAKYFSNADLPEDVGIFTGSYREMFAKGALLITDYSSVAFDFVYLEKPIIYYQFDFDEVMKGGHAYREGYFSYSNNGFGPVCETEEALRSAILSITGNDCRMEPIYLDRKRAFFHFDDRKNRERIYKETLRICGRTYREEEA